MKYMSRKGLCVRRVYRTGGGLAISFPADWVKSGEIKEGQEFIIVKQEENLVLIPAATVPKKFVPENVLREVENELSR